MVATRTPEFSMVIVDKLPVFRNDVFPGVQSFLPGTHLKVPKDEAGQPLNDALDPIEIRREIYEMYGNLFRVIHGESVYVWEEEERETQTHYKNGKLRKNPLVLSEMSYNLAKGYYGELSLRWAIWRETRKYMGFMLDRAIDRSLSDRCKIISTMLAHDTMEITYTLTKFQGLFRLNAHFNDVFMGNHPRSMGQHQLRREIFSILPAPLLEDYHTQKRLHEFKFIVREGFLDELHCPRDFWEIQKLCICGGEWRGYVPVQIEEGRKPVIVRMDFGLDAAQPIRKVVFTDEPVSENPDLDGIKPAAFNTIEPKLFRGAEDLGGILPVESIVRNFVKEGGLVVDNTE